MRLASGVFAYIWAFLAFALADQSNDFELKAPYISHGSTEIHNYVIGGSTIVSRQGVRLTGDIPGQRGWLYSQPGVKLPDAFELNLSLKVHGEGKTFFGDGMAIWFLDPDQQIEEGPVFGLRDYMKGTSIIIDTYRNNRPGKLFPLVMLMQNDGRDRYDNDHDGKANEIASCSAKGLHNPPTGQPSRLNIRYDGEALSLNLHVNGKDITCFSKTLTLGRSRRLAISASTGDLTENHIIESISLKAIEPVSSVDSVGGSVVGGRKLGGSSHRASGFENRRQSKPSWFRRFLKLTLVVTAGFGGYKLWLQYKKRKDRETDLFKFS